MDVMQLRRNLLMMGEVFMVGELSKYEKKKLTFPNASVNQTLANGAIIPCSFEPKIIIFSTDNPSGVMLSGIFSLKGKVGGIARSNNSTPSGYSEGNGTSNQTFLYDNGTFYISRINSATYWSNTDEYTFEIYG